MLDDYNKKKLLIGLVIAISGTILSFGFINSFTITLNSYVTNVAASVEDPTSLQIMNMWIGLTIGFLLVSMVGYSIVFSSKN